MVVVVDGGGGSASATVSAGGASVVAGAAVVVGAVVGGGSVATGGSVVAGEVVATEVDSISAESSPPPHAAAITTITVAAHQIRVIVTTPRDLNAIRFVGDDPVNDGEQPCDPVQSGHDDARDELLWTFRVQCRNVWIVGSIIPGDQM